MSIVIAYVRVSTEEQATEGVSIEAQEQAIRAYCLLRGLTLAEIVLDAGVSAGKPLASRPGGQKLLDAIKKTQVRAVVAFKLDRLFRNAQDCLQVTAAWDKNGIALHLLDMGGQSIDTSTAMGRFFLTIMAGAAEMERGLIRERTKTAMRHKASKNERVGKVPYGKALSIDGKHLEDDAEEQRAIQRVIELRQRGLSVRKIADDLNLNCIKARGARWHKTTVQRILRAA